jgi:putative MATE family efflux protein
MAIISRAKGAEDTKTIKAFGSLTTVLSIILGLGLGFLLKNYQTGIITFLYNPDPVTLSLISAYLNVLFWGYVVFFVSSNGRSIVQALGDTMTPLIVFGGANVLNMILDPILIFTLDMGITGAALATVIANLVACVVIYFIIIKRLFGGKLNEFFKCLTLKRKALYDIFKIGSWDLLQAVARPITGMMMFRMVLQIGGPPATAAFGIGGQLFNYTFIILVGLSMSISIMTGQSLGKGDTGAVKRLMKEAFLVAGLNMLLFAIPYLLLSEGIFKFFRNDPGIISNGVTYLRWVYPGVIFVIFPMIFGGIFKGAGATREPMVASMVANVGLKLPLAYLLAYKTAMGINGIWLAISLSVVMEAAIIAFYFKKGRWQAVEAYSS